MPVRVPTFGDSSRGSDDRFEESDDKETVPLPTGPTMRALDLPPNWDAARSGGSGGGGDAPLVSNPLGESEQAFSALMSLMRSDEYGDDNDHDHPARRRESLVSVETEVSGFWSAMANPATDRVVGDDCSHGSCGSERSSGRSTSGSLTRAMVVFFALTVLSGGVAYFAAEEDDRSLSAGALQEANFMGSLFGGAGRGETGDEDEEDERRLPNASRAGVGTEPQDREDNVDGAGTIDAVLRNRDRALREREHRAGQGRVGEGREASPRGRWERCSAA